MMVMASDAECVDDVEEKHEMMMTMMMMMIMIVNDSSSGRDGGADVFDHGRGIHWVLPHA